MIPLIGWNFYGLFDLDEGFYAAVTSEMNRRGDWIIPYYNGQPWFEKPILLYWLAKPCVAIFGLWFGPRLPSIFAGLGTYALIGWFGKRRLSESGGQVSAFALATSWLMVAANRMMLVDPLLVLTLSATFIFFWESLVENSKFRILAAACLGLSVLDKGPVGAVLFVIVAGWTFWKEPALRIKFKGDWLLSVIAFFVVVGCWYIPAYLEQGQIFVQKFLVEQNLDRFKGGDEAHRVPMPLGLLYYIPVILLGMSPWICHALRGWSRRDRDASDSAPLKRYLWVWAIAIFALFTLSSSKLPHYVLPAFPALALLAGERLSLNTLVLDKKRLLRMSLASVLLFVILQGGFMFYYGYSGQQEAQNLASFVKSRMGAHDVAAEYQMSRIAGESELALHVNETSLPSLLFYLNQDVPMVDSPSAILSLLNTGNQKVWLITRKGRIENSEISRNLGLSIKRIQTPFPDNAYELFTAEKSKVEI